MNKLNLSPYTPDRCYESRMTSAKELEYRILAAVPADEPPASGYGVIYALDGDAVFQTLAETVRMQTRKPKGYDPILVIGIAYPSREPFDMNRRCRDFTMAVEAASLPERPDGRSWPPHGGAAEFLDFLEQELMPAVSERWPIDASRQMLAGHSLGGLLTLHALFTRQHLFTHYAAGSPSTWWAENEVLRELDRFATDWQGGRPAHVLLTIGADELPDMLEGAEETARRLEPLTGAGLTLDWVAFDGEEHVSVLPCMLSRLPRFLWSGDGADRFAEA